MTTDELIKANVSIVIYNCSRNYNSENSECKICLVKEKCREIREKYGINR